MTVQAIDGMDAEFWAPRRCFLKPISEIEVALDLIDQAADAFLVGDTALARRLLEQADLRAIYTFAHSVMGKTNLEIHRYRKVDFENAIGIPAEKAKARMPAASVSSAIYMRDGYRCRFCESRIVLPMARRALEKSFPETVRWDSRDHLKHAAFYAISGCIDHVVPYTHYGDSQADNLVTTCQPCNYGRNQWRLEEVGLIDPRSYPPVVDQWDGLSRLTSM